MLKYLQVAVASFVAFVTFPVFAVLPASVGTSMTTLRDDGLALIDLAWPVVTAITVGFIIISLFKKAAGKAV